MQQYALACLQILTLTAGTEWVFELMKTVEKIQL